MNILIDTAPHPNLVNTLLSVFSALSPFLIGLLTIFAMYHIAKKQLQHEKEIQNIENAKRYEQHYLQLVSTLRNVISIYNNHYHDIVMIRMSIIGNNPINEQLILKFKSINLKVDFFKDLLVLEETAKLVLVQPIEIMVSKINNQIKDFMHKIILLHAQLEYAFFSDASTSIPPTEKLRIIKNKEANKITNDINDLIEYFSSDSFYTELSELYKTHTSILKKCKS